jgi:hypothetical protein
VAAVAEAPATTGQSEGAEIFEPWWHAASRDDRARAIFALTWIVSICYLAAWIAHGWIPHDDGLLAQSAERFLRGQLPHRDFDEMYTGGLTALHAGAFALLGTRLLTLRLVLLAAAVIWVPVVYAIARRFATPGAAGLATVAAVVWSVPNYGAAMPSWYNLFFATGGLLALLKHAETRRPRWLIAAGVLGGMSMLVKIIGLYFLAGAGLYVIYSAYHTIAERRREAGIAAFQDVGTPQSDARAVKDWRIGLVLALAVALLLLAAIAALLRPAASVATYFYFLLPTAATCLTLVARAWSAAGFSWSTCWRDVRSLAIGVAVVVVPFVALVAFAHGLGSLYAGVLVLPARRYTFAIGAPTWPGLFPVSLAVGIVATLPIRSRKLGALIAAVILGALGLVYHPQLRQVSDPQLVEAARAMLPILTCGFAAVFVARRDGPIPVQRAKAFAVIAVASLCALVAYPFFGLIYFFYYVPLVVLAAVALFGTFGQPGGTLSASAALAFSIVFAVGRMPPRSGGLMATARGGIFVGAPDSTEAQTLVDVVRAHARNGYTFATPDCPEVYFLTGLSNPTRTMYEFFTDTAGRTDRLMRMLAARRVTAITVNRQPLFSGAPDPRLMAALAARYPDSLRFGRYTVRWQPDDSSATSDADREKPLHATPTARQPRPHLSASPE